MGIALSSCTVPASGIPTFELGADEMEVGIGIHGEPGVERKSLLQADEIAELLVRSITKDPPYTRIVREWKRERGEWIDIERIDVSFKKGDQVFAFVNGMGGTPLMELYIIYRKVVQVCKKEGLRIVRSLVGNYITSLEMQGCTVTLLKMDDELVELWDAPVYTPALRWGI
jgi:dihydroxyacetone kinase-like protein